MKGSGRDDRGGLHVDRSETAMGDGTAYSTSKCLRLLERPLYGMVMVLTNLE